MKPKTQFSDLSGVNVVSILTPSYRNLALCPGAGVDGSS